MIIIYTINLSFNLSLFVVKNPIHVSFLYFNWSSVEPYLLKHFNPLFPCPRIRYVHLMAHFRMYRQIREQNLAFIRGFKSVVNADWLNMFSSPELQKLISGDTADLDISDLRLGLGLLAFVVQYQ